MGETSEEETREGTEDGASMKNSRKRSPKGAKNTKAPMDADCGICKSGKPCTCKAKKDGGCGGYGKRGDALTPQEYLAACDLGIQDRSRTYIRARLDATERLDLKCGAGSISEGEKCSKGSAQKVKDPLSVRKGIGTGAKRGSRLGAGAGALQGAALGAAGGPGGAVAGALVGAAGGYLSGGLQGGVIGGAINAGRKTGRAYNRGRENTRKGNEGIAKLNPKLKAEFAKAKASGASRKELMKLSIKQAARVGNELDKTQTKVWSANNVKKYPKGTPYEKSKMGRGDSVYAAGFTPDYDQLAI
jgi:hypothetical protein